MNLKCPFYLNDGYKFGHAFQFPEGTNLMFANFTARGTRVEGLDKVVFFGLQYFIKEYLIKDWDQNFFDRPKEEVVAKYTRRFKNYMGREANTVYIEKLHDLGYLPLEIRALPEGSRVNLRVPMLTIHNTHPDFFWLSNAIETLLSDTLWLPCTSATTADMYKSLLTDWAEKTGGDKDFVLFQGHDFSMRGHGSLESACTSGAAHLLSFWGTDTVPAIDFLEKYYNADSDKEMVGCSVDATEHSVACAGSDFGEDGGDDFAYFKRLITEVYPNGIISLVSDTFDFWGVVNPMGGTLSKLKDDIMARDGKVVIRPDSGDPVKIVTGYFDDEVEIERGSHGVSIKVKETGEFIKPWEFWGLIECSHRTFGGELNGKGYWELDSHIGAIYGDSITLARADEICSRLERKGYASTNIVFGIGSFTYQGAVTKDAIVTRDTHGFAVKATYCEINGEPKDLFKDPKTDDGLKKSARGLLTVRKEGEDFILEENRTWEQVGDDRNELKVVFFNGVMPKEESLEEIRKRLN